MTDTKAHDVQKHLKVYVIVFVALVVLTLATVTAAAFDASTVSIAIAIALLIATVKASLVASYFMHLISDRRMLYWLLILTGLFFLALMFLPLAAFLDQQGVPHVA